MRSTRINSSLLVAIILLLLLGRKTTYSQSSQDYKWYIAAHGGAAQLYGDIQNEEYPFTKFPDETELGYGIRFGRSISPAFGAHLHFTNGKFKGVKTSGDQAFASEFTDVHLAFQVNLLNLFFENKNRLVSPYLFAGAGLIWFRSEAWIASTGEIIGDAGYTNEPERSKSSREMGMMVPAGFGLDFRLTDRWYVNLESGLRLTNTDLLDGVEKGSQKDAYFYSALGVNYYFGSKSDKPVIPEAEIAKVDENPFKNTSVSVQCIFPNDLTAMDEFMMRCRVHKGLIDGKAELTQVLPIGFTVLDTTIANASRVEFQNYTLSLYWDELPADTAFDINYNVQLDKIFGNLPMSNILYLDRMNQEYKFKQDINIKRLIEPEPIVEIDEEPEIEKIKTEVAEVEFRVQIKASYKEQLSVESLEETYNLKNQVKEEKIGYWYKYTAGSFRTYDAARDYRNVLIKSNGIKGPFVIAYFNGSRLGNIKELQTVSPDYYPLTSRTQKLQTSQTVLSKYCYRVQILALYNTSESILSLKQKYGIDDVINEEVYVSWKKYTVGDCFTKSQAQELTNKLKAKGIQGAFPVLYKDGERQEQTPE